MNKWCMRRIAGGCPGSSTMRLSVARFSRICKIFDSPNVSNDGGEVVLGEMNVGISLRRDEVARRFDLTEMGVERIVHIPFAI